MRPQLNPLILGPGAPWSLPGSSLDIQFTTGRAAVNRQTSSISSLLTTTRASTGYAQTSTGSLILFPANTPRITDLGLLVEQAGTNLLTQSQTFSTWSLGAATLSTNATSAPDNTVTASKLQEDGTNASHQVLLQVSKAGSALTFTATVYAKQAERTWAQLTLFDGVSVGTRAWFNLATGVVGSTATIGAGFTAVSSSITPAANGFYRIILTATSTTTTQVQTVIYPSTTDGVVSYQGTAGSGIFIWGGDLKQDAFPTSYIPTTTVAVTRAADSITSTISWLTTNIGSMFASVGGAPALGGVVFNTHNSTETDPIYAKTSTTIAAYINGDKAVATLGSGTISGAGKYAIGFDGTGHSLVGNNGTVATNVGTFNNTSTLIIGSVAGSGSFYNGYIKRITLWQNKLADAQLKALTQ